MACTCEGSWETFTEYFSSVVIVPLNGTPQLLAYADDVNLLGDNVDTVKTHKF
jgi:hypothetical protein